MKRRLRKKFRTGEFTDYEFEVTFKAVAAVTEAEASNLVGEFLAQIESHRLVGGGSWSHEGQFSFFVCAERGVVTEAHRQALEAWLLANPAITAVTVGPRLDARREVE